MIKHHLGPSQNTPDLMEKSNMITKCHHNTTENNTQAVVIVLENAGNKLMLSRNVDVEIGKAGYRLAQSLESVLDKKSTSPFLDTLNQLLKSDFEVSEHLPTETVNFFHVHFLDCESVENRENSILVFQSSSDYGLHHHILSIGTTYSLFDFNAFVEYEAEQLGDGLAMRNVTDSHLVATAPH
jgi:hypothetical protein